MPTNNFEIDNVLQAKPYGLSEKQKESIFRKNIITELKHHYEKNNLYRQFCQKNNFNPNKFNGLLEDIPYIPVQVFKMIGTKLKSVENSMLSTKLESSATSGKPSTILLDKVTSRRQVRAMTRVMSEVISSERMQFYIMDLDPRSSKEANYGARAAAIKGYLNFASSSYYFMKVNNSKELIFDLEKFITIASKCDEPTIIFGFTFVLYSCVFKSLKEKNHSIKLPPGSKVIHIGGWKKLESEKVEKNRFNSEISELFGLSTTDVIDVYGFTEQMGLNYPDCEYGWKHIHAYSDLIVRDELTHKPIHNGKPGLLEFLSPVPHSYPGNVVLTDDIGILESTTCKCGKVGKRFKILRRAKKAEVRGCGDVMGEMTSRTKNSIKVENINENIVIHHSPSEIGEVDSLSKLKELKNQINAGSKWIKSQHSSDLIALIDLARKEWSQNQKLLPLMNNGLKFLIDWSDPNRLRKMLEISLNGKIGYLDTFMLRNESQSSSIRAFPRGLVIHWLSGNVPLLGMFAIIQSMLCKNSNLIKLSSSDSGSLIEILKTFNSISYKNPSGKIIEGKDLLNSIGVVYFDHKNKNIASNFSANADTRIAWGGKEAVESVISLPRKYNCQDIIFGPKLSMIFITKEALASEKIIKKLLRRVATDCSVFDQFACASPHNVFIEEGGLISAKEFAFKLQSAMDKALIRLPKDVPDEGQSNKIRAKLSEYDFIGDSWNDSQLRWAILYSKTCNISDPTYSRVVTINSVENLNNVIDKIDSSIQSVGLAASGIRKLEIAEKLANKGVLRIPDIGNMTHFDSPWDGMYMIDRLINWVTLGGPN